MRFVAKFVRRAPWTAVVAEYGWRLFQPKFSAGAVGVVLNERGQVLLVEHVFHPYTPWGLPGGWVGPREDPAQTVKREVREELNLDIQINAILLVEVDGRNHIDFAFLCSTVPDAQVGKLSRELLDYRWCNLDELPRLHRFHYQALMRAKEAMAV
jgi:8-oxo-dGTP diphosphatase